MEGDVMMYVVGGGEENEILLFQVVLALRDSLAILLKYVPYLLLRLSPAPFKHFTIWLRGIQTLITMQEFYG